MYNCEIFVLYPLFIKFNKQQKVYSDMYSAFLSEGIDSKDNLGWFNPLKVHSKYCFYLIFSKLMPLIYVRLLNFM